MSYRHDLNSKVEKNTFHNGGKLSILGKRISVNHKTHTFSRIRCELVNHEFTIFLPSGYNIEENNNQIKNKIIKFGRFKLKKIKIVLIIK